MLFDGRIRVYNEIFIPAVGITVLIGIWILLQRSRLGMIIRAGVQDREMVEALGINVQRVFNIVFAMGIGLAVLGGGLAAPSMGLSNAMGETLILNALIALAIGGLTTLKDQSSYGNDGTLSGFALTGTASNWIGSTAGKPFAKSNIS